MSKTQNDQVAMKESAGFIRPPHEYVECRQLEQAIAYEAARSDIELFCRDAFYRADGSLWHRIDSVLEDVRDLVKKALRYLDLIGVTEHDTTKAEGHIVRFLDRAVATSPLRARPLADWAEEYGDVTWWRFPVCEPAWIGTPLDFDWKPDYYTHFTPHPELPAGAA